MDQRSTVQAVELLGSPEQCSHFQVHVLCGAYSYTTGSTQAAARKSGPGVEERQGDRHRNRRDQFQHTARHHIQQTHLSHCRHRKEVEVRLTSPMHTVNRR